MLPFAKRLIAFISSTRRRLCLHLFGHLFLLLEAMLQIKLIGNLHESLGRRPLTPFCQLGQIVATGFPLFKRMILLQIFWHLLFLTGFEHLLFDELEVFKLGKVARAAR